MVLPPQAAAGFEELTVQGLADELRTPGDARIRDEVATEERDGEPVVVVSDDSGGTLVVAGEDEPYPPEITSTEDDGTLTLGEFGAEQEVTGPEDPLDVAELGG